MDMNLPFLWTPPREGDGSIAVVSGGAEAPSPARPTYYGLEGSHHLQQPFVYERVFSPTQCAEIIALGRSLPMWKGRSSAEEENYRSCRTSWIEEAEATRWIFERLRQVVISVNDLYHLRVAGFGEPLHYIAYEAGDHFDWHSDLGDGPTSTRKISISIQLSEAADYEGGDMEFCPHGPILEFRGIGNALLFPAYIPHRVSAVTRGNRHALVAWIHGPSFE